MKTKLTGVGLIFVSVVVSAFLGCAGMAVMPPAKNLSAEAALANLQIDFATGDLRRQYESFHEFTHVDIGFWMIITTDKPVQDFEYVRFIPNLDLAKERGSFFLGETLYSIGEFTPEKPFMVKTFGYWGAIPQFGISFTDADNTKKYFLISESMKDGNVRLIEINIINNPAAEAAELLFR